MKKNIFLLFLLLSFLACYILSYGQLLESYNTRSKKVERSFISHVHPIVVKLIAGEFKGLLSSFLVLDTGARLGTKIIRTVDGELVKEQKKFNWKEIHQLLILSQSLDPSFQQTYFLAQGWLPWDAKMIEETQNILETSANHRPWDWQPKRIQAFNLYYFLNRPGEAGKLMIQAGMIKNSPPFLAILGARLAHKGNETQTAIALMKYMLENKSDNDPGIIAIRTRYEALLGVQLLEKASKDYHQVTKKHPANLNELVNKGIIKSLPDNPYGTPYCIDAEGKIHFDNLNCNYTVQQ